MFYQNTPNTSRTQPQSVCGRTPANGCGNSNNTCQPTQSCKPPHSGARPMPACPPASEMDYECGAREGYLDQYPIAMAYVPWQRFGELFPLERGFQAGTIFQELDLPFTCASPACKSCQSCNRRGGRL